MSYYLPSSLSTDFYNNKTAGTVSGQKIGTKITDAEIKEYDYYGRIKVKNDMTDHKGGYNNFFGYMHPRVVPPNWWTPCFDDKQIRMKVHNF